MKLFGFLLASSLLAACVFSAAQAAEIEESETGLISSSRLEQQLDLSRLDPADYAMVRAAFVETSARVSSELEKGKKKHKRKLKHKKGKKGKRKLKKKKKLSANARKLKKMQAKRKRKHKKSKGKHHKKSRKNKRKFKQTPSAAAHIKAQELAEFADSSNPLGCASTFKTGGVKYDVDENCLPVIPDQTNAILEGAKYPTDNVGNTGPRQLALNPNEAADKIFSRPHLGDGFSHEKAIKALQKKNMVNEAKAEAETESESTSESKTESESEGEEKSEE